MSDKFDRIEITNPVLRQKLEALTEPLDNTPSWELIIFVAVVVFVLIAAGVVSLVAPQWVAQVIGGGQ